MRKLITLIMLAFFLTGCANYFQNYLRPDLSETDIGCDLTGHSKTSIISKFGQPQRKDIDYSVPHRRDTWYYYYKSGERLKVIFRDGRVSGFSYR